MTIIGKGTYIVLNEICIVGSKVIVQNKIVFYMYRYCFTKKTKYACTSIHFYYDGLQKKKKIHYPI